MHSTITDLQLAPPPRAAIGAGVAPHRSKSTVQRVAIAEASLLFVLAVGIRLIQLDHTVFIDELNHIFAARSLLTEGTLDIGDAGPYQRAWIYTYMVAGMFRVFGESLVAARIPAVLFGAALVSLIFLWVRSVSGRLAGWVAALLVCFDPISIYLSQQVRFYTPQAFFFWLAAIGVYRTTAAPQPPFTRRVPLLVAIAAALWLAFHFQPISAVGIAALFVWFSLSGVPWLLWWIGRDRRRGWIAAGAATVALGALAFVAVNGAAIRAWEMFNYADLWAQDSAGQIRYYHWYLLEQYPTLWTLFPLVFFAALLARPRAALFCAWIFGAAFVFHSFAAWKTPRYLFYAMPGFFAVSGLAVSQVIHWAREELSQRATSLSPRRISPHVAAATAGILLLVGTGTFLALGNTAFVETRKMLTISDADWTLDNRLRGEADWGKAAATLHSLLERDRPIVVSSSDLKALYFLDQLDAEVSAAALFQGREEPAPEFTLSQKVDRPTISTPASLARLIDCYPEGIVIIEDEHWRDPAHVTAEAADFLLEHTRSLPLAAGSHLRAFRWERNGETNRGSISAQVCDPLPLAEGKAEL